MTEVAASEPLFDPRWLDALAVACAPLAQGRPRLEDLYLERRLELVVTSLGSTSQVDECRTEGAAVRWSFPGRNVLLARSGISPRAIAQLITIRDGQPKLAALRPAPPADLDPPRGWLDWAIELCARLGGSKTTVRFLSRQATVVRPDGWAAVHSPELVRVEHHGEVHGALLSVWQHPQLTRWLGAMSEPPPPRRYCLPSGLQTPVLFGEGSAGVLMHELVGHLAEADLVTRGGSPLADLVGASIMDAGIEIEDDPTRLDLPGAFDCDDEGVPARPIALVSRGVLVGWLCDRAGAARLGTAPGRARRSGLDAPPVARMSNLVVAPGTVSPEDMERGLGRGVLVTRLSGAAVDPVSGRVVIRVERGWELRHGRRRRALDPCALTGSALEILANIDHSVGSDQASEWRLGWCVKGGCALPTGSATPTMLVKRLEVL